MVYTAKCVLVANRHILFTTIDRNLGVQHIVLFDRVNAGKSLLGASFRTSATQIPPFIHAKATGTNTSIAVAVDNFIDSFSID